MSIVGVPDGADRLVDIAFDSDVVLRNLVIEEGVETISGYTVPGATMPATYARWDALVSRHRSQPYCPF